MQLLRRLIVPLVVAVAAVDCRSQLDPDSVHPINTQRGSCKSKFCELFGGTCGVYGSSADCKGRLEKEGCKGQGCKCCIPEPDNQCLANEGGNSVLWNKMNTAKMAIQETINEGNADVIDILDPKIDLLEDKMNYVISQLESLIEHRGTSCTTLNTAAATSTNTTMPTTTTTTTTTGCPGGVILGRQCFIFSNDTLNWTDAAEACGRNRGQLAVVSQQPTLIAEYILTYYDNVKFWVGATDTAVEGSWVWIDGQPMDSQFPWPSNQPDNGGGNEHCLMFNYEDAYNDDPCHKEFRYVCEQ